MMGLCCVWDNVRVAGREKIAIRDAVGVRHEILGFERILCKERFQRGKGGHSRLMFYGSLSRYVGCRNKVATAV